MPIEFRVSGPYHYPHDKHPCYRIDTSDRIVASIFFVDENEERAYEEAVEVARALKKYHADKERPGYTQYTSFRP